MKKYLPFYGNLLLVSMKPKLGLYNQDLALHWASKCQKLQKELKIKLPVIFLEMTLIDSDIGISTVEMFEKHPKDYLPPL